MKYMKINIYIYIYKTKKILKISIFLFKAYIDLKRSVKCNTIVSDFQGELSAR